jgi:DNA-binding NarL/FixJ family response regulator
MALAAVLRRSGDAQAADREERLATQEFKRLGVAVRPRRAGVAESDLLSSRELEVLRLVADGLSNRQIAARLVLSQHTVHRHVSNILVKLGQSSRAAAAADAARKGLL